MVYMLLNDIGKSVNTTLNKINRHLEENYGFKITKDVANKDLTNIMEKIKDEITELKIKGDDAKTSSEISKRLLVLEGIKSIQESMSALESPDLEHVVESLAEFVADSFCLSGTTDDDFDECVRDGMKHYRSSRYRFPDDLVEQRVRQRAMDKIYNSPSTDSVGASTPINTDELNEAPFEYDSKRSGGLGGYAASVPDTPEARRIMKRLDNPALSLVEPEEEKIPMIRDKHGRMVPDPFAAQAAARRKGIVMKENLVKRLRVLLETEVSQAEVMMAAKGFAQELQEMIEKIGRLQNEDLPPVTDQMRETYGTDSSSAFQTQIYSALQGVMDSLYTAKGQVDDAVTNMASTGRVSAEVDMDKSVEMDPNMDLDNIEDFDTGPESGSDEDLDNIEDEFGDEFGGAEEEEPLGRSRKVESVELLQKKIVEMQKLVKRVKHLKESKNYK